MRLGRRWSCVTLAILVLLAAGALTVAPAQQASTLVVGLVAEPVALDPAQVTDLNSNRVGRRVVETLVAFADETTQIVPGLAESWTISKDGLSYTFKLRKGISFHDGTPFNAAAVKFSIERQINPEHPANKLGKYPFAAYFFGNVKAVEVMDDSTVRFILKEPRASFLAILTAGAASIVSPTAAMKLGQDYAASPVGTGPFKFATWDHGQRVVLDKNPGYWRFPVKVDHVIFRPITEDQARLTELLTGALDLIVGTPPDFVDQLENNPKVTLQRQVGAHVWYLGFNNAKKPFDDKRVRQALNYAVNKDAIVRDVLKGTGAVSKGPVLPGTWGDDAGLKAFPYDPARARKLLAEAGLPNGFSTTLWVPESGSGMQSPVAMSTIIQSNLKAVGVTVNLQTMEWGTYLAKLRTKEQEMFALSWMAGSEDPDLVLYPLLHSSQWTPVGPNRAMYKNPRFDDVLTQARLTTDQAKRAELYREAQRLLQDDPPWIFIDHEVQTAAYAKRVQGFKLHPSFDLRVETISLK
ncbi:MAG TPA: ABC transporter substrate-binding protein [Candidatus Dormibacteraeota bacterium]|jgi:peptide/nickel transport system substrate-binding protein|nr:ABC transporter substrate-binding protein [Candidatus Dormibacteraeota bacterium]